MVQFLLSLSRTRTSAPSMITGYFANRWVSLTAAMIAMFTAGTIYLVSQCHWASSHSHNTTKVSRLLVGPENEAWHQRSAVQSDCDNVKHRHVGGGARRALL